jgi:acetyl esterase/lipase
MHIANKMIRKEIRTAGVAVRLIMPYFTEKKFLKINKIMEHMKHRNFSKSLQMDEIYISRTDGSKLRVVIFKPTHEINEAVPGVLWIHGGGYGIGVPEQDFGFAEILEERHDCVIFMPDYTLGTEAPYPAAFNDCYDTLLYMKAHADEYQIKTDQIITGGDSAGGGLCVAVDIKAKDTKNVNIAFTMPLYPMLDARKTASSTDNDAPVWNTKSNEVGWNIYLKNQEMSKYAVPALETDYTGFPPTLTYVGTIEPFYDETMEFIRQLKAQDVSVTYKEYEGCFHAFDIICAKTDVGKDARAFLGAHFEQACETLFAQN